MKINGLTPEELAHEIQVLLVLGCEPHSLFTALIERCYCEGIHSHAQSVIRASVEERQSIRKHQNSAVN